MYAVLTPIIKVKNKTPKTRINEFDIYSNKKYFLKAQNNH